MADVSEKLSWYKQGGSSTATHRCWARVIIANAVIHSPFHIGNWQSGILSQNPGLNSWFQFLKIRYDERNKKNRKCIL